MSNKTPDFAIISSDLSDDAGEVVERRRRPRLGLAAEQFRLLSTGKVFSVANLSLDGMALRVIEPNDLLVFPVATKIEGLLKLRGEKYEISGTVSRLGQGVVVIVFERLNSDVRNVLERFLNPEVLGRELKPIPTDAATAWFHGPSGTDLLLWRGSDNQYKRLTVYIFGIYIQWDNDNGLSTGTATPSFENELSEQWGMLRFETMLTKADAKPDAGKLSIAKALLMSSNISEDIKRWCVLQIECSGSARQ